MHSLRLPFSCPAPERPSASNFHSGRAERIASMTQRLWLLGLTLLAALLTPAVRADDPPSQPYVVLVGIDRFEDPQIKARPHAEADAKALYDIVTAPEHLGVPATNVKLLL